MGVSLGNYFGFLWGVFLSFLFSSFCILPGYLGAPHAFNKIWHYSFFFLIKKKELVYLSRTRSYDIPVGSNYTWSNNRDPLALCKINKFLLSLEWEAHFPDVSQRRQFFRITFLYCLTAMLSIGVKGIFKLRICG